MLTVLSLMDDRSRPKGSRDPLGVEAIWSFMGRKVVGNLTSVTSHLDHFMVALLCSHHSNMGSTDTEQIQEDFLRAEQLCAYLRLASGNDVVLGITRAKANFNNAQLLLGKNEAAQILSNQLSYGLWGLYSTAMQVAGLIDGPERRPTVAGAGLVRSLIDCLGETNWQSFTNIARGDFADFGRVKDLSPSFDAMLKNANIRRTVVEALLSWSTAKPLQLELYSLAREYLLEQKHNGWTGENDVQTFCNWLLRQEKITDDLQKVFSQMQELEPLLILAGSLMNWLQGQKGQNIADLVDLLQPSLKSVNADTKWLAVANLPHRDFLKTLSEAATAQDASALIKCVLDQNREIMSQRGGGAWIESTGDKLVVRVGNDRAHLPPDLGGYCRERWWNNYFIASFLQIAKAAVL